MCKEQQPFICVKLWDKPNPKAWNEWMDTIWKHIFKILSIEYPNDYEFLDRSEAAILVKKHGDNRQVRVWADGQVCCDYTSFQLRTIHSSTDARMTFEDLHEFSHRLYKPVKDWLGYSYDIWIMYDVSPSEEY